VKELLASAFSPISALPRDREIQLEARARSRCSATCGHRGDPGADVDTIYQVPVAYHADGLRRRGLPAFRAGAPGPDLATAAIVRRIREPEGEVSIAVVGKYTSLLDSYQVAGRGA